MDIDHKDELMSWDSTERSKNLRLKRLVTNVCWFLFWSTINRTDPLLMCFDTVFRRPHRWFSIALKVILSLSDRHKIFTVINFDLKYFKMPFLVKSISLKNFEINKMRISRDLDLLLKIWHQELKMYPDFQTITSSRFHSNFWINWRLMLSSDVNTPLL